MPNRRVLLVSGSTRTGSMSSAALRGGSPSGWPRVAHRRDSRAAPARALGDVPPRALVLVVAALARPGAAPHRRRGRRGRRRRRGRATARRKTEPGGLPAMSEEASDGRRERRERNRQAVLDAAPALVDEGRGGPTVEQVTERSGLSQRSTFRYFDGLDDLHRAVVQRKLELAGPLLAFDPVRETPSKNGWPASSPTAASSTGPSSTRAPRALAPTRDAGDRGRGRPVPDPHRRTAPGAVRPRAHRARARRGRGARGARRGHGLLRRLGPHDPRRWPLHHAGLERLDEGAPRPPRAGVPAERPRRERSPPR